MSTVDFKSFLKNISNDSLTVLHENPRYDDLLSGMADMFETIYIRAKEIKLDHQLEKNTSNEYQNFLNINNGTVDTNYVFNLISKYLDTEHFRDTVSLLIQLYEKRRIDGEIPNLAEFINNHVLPSFKFFTLNSGDLHKSKGVKHLLESLFEFYSPVDEDVKMFDGISEKKREDLKNERLHKNTSYRICINEQLIKQNYSEYDSIELKPLVFEQTSRHKFVVVQNSETEQKILFISDRNREEWFRLYDNVNSIHIINDNFFGVHLKNRRLLLFSDFFNVYDSNYNFNAPAAISEISNVYYIPKVVNIRDKFNQYHMNNLYYIDVKNNTNIEDKNDYIFDLNRVRDLNGNIIFEDIKRNMGLSFDYSLNVGKYDYISVDYLWLDFFNEDQDVYDFNIEHVKIIYSYVVRKKTTLDDLTTTTKYYINIARDGYNYDHKENGFYFQTLAVSDKSYITKYILQERSLNPVFKKELFKNLANKTIDIKTVFDVFYLNETNISSFGEYNFIGEWNPGIGVPSLSPNHGDYWVASVDGFIDYLDINNWRTGEILLWNGRLNVWERGNHLSSDTNKTIFQCDHKILYVGEPEFDYPIEDTGSTIEPAYTIKTNYEKLNGIFELTLSSIPINIRNSSFFLGFASNSINVFGKNPVVVFSYVDNSNNNRYLYFIKTDGFVREHNVVNISRLLLNYPLPNSRIRPYSISLDDTSIIVNGNDVNNLENGNSIFILDNLLYNIPLDVKINEISLNYNSDQRLKTRDNQKFYKKYDDNGDLILALEYESISSIAERYAPVTTNMIGIEPFLDMSFTEQMIEDDVILDHISFENPIGDGDVIVKEISNSKQIDIFSVIVSGSPDDNTYRIGRNSDLDKVIQESNNFSLKLYDIYPLILNYNREQLVSDPSVYGEPDDILIRFIGYENDSFSSDKNVIRFESNWFTYTYDDSSTIPDDTIYRQKFKVNLYDKIQKKTVSGANDDMLFSWSLYSEIQKLDDSVLSYFLENNIRNIIGGYYVGKSEKEITEPSGLSSGNIWGASGLSLSKNNYGNKHLLVSSISNNSVVLYKHNEDLEYNQYITITPNNYESGDRFGSSTYMDSEDFMVVGSPRTNNDGVFRSGVAYSYHYTDNTWYEKKIEPELPVENSMFGLKILSTVIENRRYAIVFSIGETEDGGDIISLDMNIFSISLNDINDSWKFLKRFGDIARVLRSTNLSTNGSFTLHNNFLCVPYMNNNPYYNKINMYKLIISDFPDDGSTIPEFIDDGSTIPEFIDDGSTIPDITDDGSTIPDIDISWVDNVGVFSSGNHSLFLKDDGSIISSGLNDKGELGDGTTDSESTPVSVVGVGVYSHISGGNGVSYGLRNDGSVWAWGYDLRGALGRNTINDDSVSPVSVVGDHTFIQISESRGLKSDGSVWAWGNNLYGGIGNNESGTLTHQSSPVSVVGNHSFISISGSHALKDDGSIWAWGYNEGYGVLGDGTTNSRSSPVSIAGDFESTISDFFVDVSGGQYHTLALQSDGSVWAWGNNGRGQVGDGTINSKSSPVSVLGNHSFVQIICNRTSSLALKEDGSVWGWGGNQFGQLGVGQGNVGNNYSSPILISGSGSFIKIFGGGDSSFGVKSDGSVWGWGRNHRGQLGNGYTEDVSSPELLFYLIDAPIPTQTPEPIFGPELETYYTFEYNDDNPPDGDRALMEFGARVMMNDDFIIIGCNTLGDAIINGKEEKDVYGSAWYVFKDEDEETYPSFEYIDQLKFKDNKNYYLSNHILDEESGVSNSMTNEYVAIGYPNDYNESFTSKNHGSVSVFWYNKANEVWDFTHKIINDDKIGFGYNLDMSGKHLAVGTKNDNNVYTYIINQRPGVDREQRKSLARIGVTSDVPDSETNGFIVDTLDSLAAVSFPNSRNILNNSNIRGCVVVFNKSEDGMWDNGELVIKNTDPRYILGDSLQLNEKNNLIIATSNSVIPNLHNYVNYYKLEGGSWVLDGRFETYAKIENNNISTVGDILAFDSIQNISIFEYDDGEFTNETKINHDVFSNIDNISNIGDISEDLQELIGMASVNICSVDVSDNYLVVCVKYDHLSDSAIVVYSIEKQSDNNWDSDNLYVLYKNMYSSELFDKSVSVSSDVDFVVVAEKRIDNKLEILDFKESNITVFRRISSGNWDSGYVLNSYHIDNRMGFGTNVSISGNTILVSSQYYNKEDDFNKWYNDGCKLSSGCVFMFRKIDSTDNVWDYGVQIRPIVSSKNSEFGRFVYNYNDSILIADKNKNLYFYSDSDLGDYYGLDAVVDENWETVSSERSYMFGNIQDSLNPNGTYYLRLPETYDTLPDFGDTVPDFGDTVPDFGDTVPDFGDTVPDFGDTVPDFGTAVPDLSSILSTRMVLESIDKHSSAYFGWSVDVDGEYAILSQRFLDNVIDKSQNGRVYIYKNIDDVWVYEATIETPEFLVDLRVPNQFGFDIAISGDVIVVSMLSWKSDIIVPNDYENYQQNKSTGNVYVFKKTGTTWEDYELLSNGNKSSLYEIYKDAKESNLVLTYSLETNSIVPIDDEKPIFSNFGYTVDIYEDFIAVGNPDKPAELDKLGKQMYTDGRSVIIFKIDGGLISNDIFVCSSDYSSGLETDNDKFGASLEIINGNIIIGSPSSDNPINSDISSGGFAFLSYGGGNTWIPKHINSTDIDTIYQIDDLKLLGKTVSFFVDSDNTNNTYIVVCSNKSVFCFYNDTFDTGGEISLLYYDEIAIENEEIVKVVTATDKVIILTKRVGEGRNNIKFYDFTDTELIMDESFFINTTDELRINCDKYTGTLVIGDVYYSDLDFGNNTGRGYVLQSSYEFRSSFRGLASDGTLDAWLDIYNIPAAVQIVTELED